jgi:EAL and modified HD-GYP domain-containing signal transduction protein
MSGETMDIFIARQPIFDRHHNVFAYELLYRKNESNAFDGSVASDVATSILLMNSYLSFGLHNLVGAKKAFINFDKQLILNDIPLLLNTEHVVIELLESIIPDEVFLDKLQTFKEHGYTIALDDYKESYPYPKMTALCDIVKVEFLGASARFIKRASVQLKAKGKLILAEKVETRDDFEWAKSIGFDYFQGYFFSKPALIKSKGIEDSSYQYMRLMSEMHVEEPNYKKIAQIIETDIALTYKLLKLVNSKFIQNQKIHSIQHALSILGIDTFRKWLSLAMIQSFASVETNQLVITSMARAHLLELIATHSNLKKQAHEMTLIGLLSVLDVLLEKNMEDLLIDLPISDNIKNTLLGFDTPFSCAFSICLSYERGQFDQLESCSKQIGYDLKLFTLHYFEAIKWADAVFTFLHNPIH